jgi:class 3 adenylate cyclase/pimeloyl-ACP methyl ester carboxylesterase
MTPEVHYAKSGNVHIAYAVAGKGPVDLVVAPGWVSNVAAAWTSPPHRYFYTRLSAFCRLFLFDKRGTGMSDRDVAVPTMEERMDDLRAVMDAVGVRKTAIFGISEGGSLAMLFAATHPKRTTKLALYGTFARRLWSPDYPWAPTPEERQRHYELIEAQWGGEMDVRAIAPSAAADSERARLLSDYYRASASPSAAIALAKLNTLMDIRHALPSIQAPTLVMHRKGDAEVKVEQGRWIASQIPGARYVEMPGDDHVPFYGDSDAVIDELQEFLTGERPVHEVERVLSTVVFTDIVRSTQLATELGDRAWCALLEQHFSMVTTSVSAHRGRLVKTTGDGALATFDGPARASRCAQAIVLGARSLGLEVRAGVHCGEIELRGDDVAGIAVHIASRVAAEASPGEVLVSRTVRDLTSGAGLALVDRGSKILAGVSETVQLYSLDSESR